jgi:hypothetical protein
MLGGCWAFLHPISLSRNIGQPQGVSLANIIGEKLEFTNF